MDGLYPLELLPINEHPFDGSWGYQPTACMHRPAVLVLATTSVISLSRTRSWSERDSRLGARPLPDDDFALAEFDGTNLYEHSDPRKAIIRTGTR